MPGLVVSGPLAGTLPLDPSRPVQVSALEVLPHRLAGIPAGDAGLIHAS